MRILGIESSCDETAAAVLEIKNGAVKILSNVISSQIKIHKKYGGVVPEVAARKHTEVVFDVIKKALRDANASNYTRMPRKHDANKLSEIDLIAVTRGPGLVTSLRVGVLAAQALASFGKKPLVGVNHIEAHLLSPWLAPHPTSSRVQGEEKKKGSLYTQREEKRKGSLYAQGEEIRFPALGLVVSGGHTELILANDFGKYKLVGSTRDDAVGEAFDKVAKILGLGYPGGPAVAREAAKITNYELRITNIKFPRPMINTDNCDFSFAGLKTAVLYLTKKMNLRELKKATPEICAEFQKAAIEVLVHKTKKAAEKYKVKSIIVGGGVAANKELRSALQKLEWPVFLPALEYTGDNAAMIAYAGYHKYCRNKKNRVFKIIAEPNLKM